MKWVRVCDGNDLICTEVMHVGSVCFMRSYVWDAGTDEAKGVSVIQIDEKAGLELLKWPAS